VIYINSYSLYVGVFGQLVNIIIYLDLKVRECAVLFIRTDAKGDVIGFVRAANLGRCDVLDNIFIIACG
jgi:hypothetical protein